MMLSHDPVGVRHTSQGPYMTFHRALVLVQVSAPAADKDLGPLMAGFSQDFGTLKAEFDRLLGSLSASVHDATELTLEHTTLYDSAVGELQVRQQHQVQVMSPFATCLHA